MRHFYSLTFAEARRYANHVVKKGTYAVVHYHTEAQKCRDKCQVYNAPKGE